MVNAGRAAYTVISPGAVPERVRIAGYKNLRPNAHDSMVVAPVRGPLLHYRLASGGDTVSLDGVPFTVQRGENSATFTSTSPAITIEYLDARVRARLSEIRCEVPGRLACSVAVAAPPEGEKNDPVLWM